MAHHTKHKLYYCKDGPLWVSWVLIFFTKINGALIFTFLEIYELSFMNLLERLSEATTYLLQSDGESCLAIVKSLEYNEPREKHRNSASTILIQGH